MLVSANAKVAPSGFEANDGNMVLGNSLVPADSAQRTGPPLHDGVLRLDDSHLHHDSLGKGSKEDDLVPNVVNQSVPPKDDFKNVHLATENIGVDRLPLPLDGQGGPERLRQPERRG